MEPWDQPVFFVECQAPVHPDQLLSFQSAAQFFLAQGGSGLEGDEAFFLSAGGGLRLEVVKCPWVFEPELGLPWCASMAEGLDFLDAEDEGGIAGSGTVELEAVALASFSALAAAFFSLL